MCEVSKIDRGGVFSSEEEFQRIYGECLENQPQATEAIRSSYKGMHETFQDYLCAIEEHMFRYAYQCGYEAALKGGVAV